jgi:hypothetical protein
MGSIGFFARSVPGSRWPRDRTASGDVEGIRAYVRTDAFLVAFGGPDPVMRCHSRAEALGEAKARHPLVPSRPIDAKRTQKFNWSDAAMRAKPAVAYATAGGDDERASRMLGVSLGSARFSRRGP